MSVNESFRLLHVYLEITSTVEEGVLAIDLGDTKIVDGADGEELTYGVDSDDGSEGLIEIQFSFLRKSFDDNTGFVLLKNICCIAFRSTYPSQGAGRVFQAVN